LACSWETSFIDGAVRACTALACKNIRIDREHIRVTFGNDDESLRLELLHGMTKKEEVLTIAQKLRYETGVQAEIYDWYRQCKT
jgi:hypothetical protein